MRVRNLGLPALLASCAVMMAVGCGSSAKKNAVRPVDGDSGAAGAEPAPSEGGAAGAMPEPGAAGEGGASGDAGASGAAGEGGESGGPGGVVNACVTAGSTTKIQYAVDGSVSVCPGARLILPIAAGEATPEFTCCAVTDTQQSLAISGRMISDTGDGYLDFIVPVNVPVGDRVVDVACAGGVAQDQIVLTVKNGEAPFVKSADESIHQGDPLHITGTHLSDVDRVLIVPTDASAAATTCYVQSDEVTDTSVTCNFDGVSIGEYEVVVLDGCGAALVKPKLTILPPT